ncbi:hypothetical protein ACFL5V_08425 [Fibrobacterota bacterium]
MNGNRIRMAFYSYLLISLFLMASTAIAAGKVTLEGRIASDEDDDGKTTAIYIAIPEVQGDEEIVKTYYIENSGKGAELIEHVFEDVKVTGTVRKNENGENVIRVSSYELIIEEGVDDSEESIESEE